MSKVYALIIYPFEKYCIKKVCLKTFESPYNNRKKKKNNLQKTVSKNKSINDEF